MTPMNPLQYKHSVLDNSLLNRLSDMSTDSVRDSPYDECNSILYKSSIAVQVKDNDEKNATDDEKLEQCLLQLNEEINQRRNYDGSTDPTLADLLSSLALYHEHVTDDFHCALKHFQEAQTILQSSISAYHYTSSSEYVMKMGIAWTDIGDTLSKLNRYDKASQAYEEALNILRAQCHLPENNLRVMTAKTHESICIQHKGSS